LRIHGAPAHTKLLDQYFHRKLRVRNVPLVKKHDFLEQPFMRRIDPDIWGRKSYLFGICTLHCAVQLQEVLYFGIENSKIKELGNIVVGAGLKPPDLLLLIG
jgi:hypothetical protein